MIHNLLSWLWHDIIVVFFEMVNTAIQSEDELVSEIKGQSRLAFNNLYSGYSPLLCYTIRKITGNDTLLENILQDTFIHIWTYIDEYDSKQERIYSWMIRIAKTKALDAEQPGTKYTLPAISPGETLSNFTTYLCIC
jgi:hypothetical protein